MTATYQGKSEDMLLSVDRLQEVEQHAGGAAAGLAQSSGIAAAASSSSATPLPKANAN